MEEIPLETPLCELAYKYKTDKCPQIAHSYTPFYYELFKDRRESIKKVLELGIGYLTVKNIVEGYVVGASLFMWRDFFPNAQIYGADIVPTSLISGDRIESFFCDETKKEDLEALIEKTGSDIDIFIDDGSHIKEDQIFTAKTLMPLLKKDVIYIIEDARFDGTIRRELSEYDCEMAPLSPIRKEDYRHTHNNKIVIVKNK